MNKTKFLNNSGKAGIVLSAVLILTLAGCSGNADAPNGGGQAPSPSAAQASPPADVQAPPTTVVQVQSPADAVQDDYVYYPAYGVYYSSGRHQYASYAGGAWISEPAPRGVAVDALRASPSVKMDFHDSPANHHADVARQYPKNWKPSGQN
jgi:hypothetical protein